jgi:uncharacterized membrane protein
MPSVDKTIDVEVPVRTAYNQWTQFEEFPEFMHNVVAVTQQAPDRLHWEAKVGGAHREWDAQIVEQEPDQVIAWRAVDGTPNAGAVQFESLGTDRTRVRLTLEVPAQSWTDEVAATLGVLDTVVEADLGRFKEYIEARGPEGETGGWRGEVHDEVPREAHNDVVAEDLSPPAPDVLGDARVGADLTGPSRSI